MNVWEFINQYNSKDNLPQYKKWLDISSSHFFSFEIDDEILSFQLQKKVAKKAFEEYKESGNSLIFISSKYYYKVNGVLLPLFLTPIFPEINHKDKSIVWTTSSSIFTFNTDISPKKIEVKFDEIDDWISKNSIINLSYLNVGSLALYFNLNTKKFIANDLLKISNIGLESNSIKDVFHNEIQLSRKKCIPDFLSSHHEFKLDYSQAQAILEAKEKSIVISGPPGTGKSQTILQLALEEVHQGRKVAIVSQKKAALDIIYQRISDIELNEMALNLNTLFEEDASFIEDIENSLSHIIHPMPKDIEHSINLVYFNHCIRTLEDYFDAYKNISPQKTISKYDSITERSIWKGCNLFKWLYPNIRLIHHDYVELENQLDILKQHLLDLKIDFEDTTFELLEQLEGVFQLVINLNISDLIQYIQNRKLKSQLTKIDKQIKQLHKKKPNLSSNIDSISIEKLTYLVEYFRNTTIPLLSIFNKKASIILDEIYDLYPEWKKLNIWKKIELLEQAILFNQWKSELNSLEQLKEEIGVSKFSNTPFEVLNYLDLKITSGTPIWQFVWNKWVLNKDFERKKIQWKSIFDISQHILKLNPNFGNYNILEFINSFQVSEELNISHIEWTKICSLDFQNMDDWKAFLEINKVKSKDSSPILKNYTKRDIAQIARYVRTNYAKYTSYNAAKYKKNLEEKLSKEFMEIVMTRTRSQTEKRHKWKKNVQYIQKNWSKKRKFPSSYQYISELDFEFLLWLKPIFIGTLERFSQYTPFEIELFDTLIVDESSQIEALDIIPAMYRAKKIIVVGDREQLTPTKFFRLTNQNSTSYESILELAEEKLPIYQLNYHYRSSYRDLITFSNQYFYKHSLHTTKSSSSDAIEWINCPQGIYYQRRNREEALKAMDLLKKIASENSKLSVGVISFSIQQKEEIELQLELAMNSDNQLNQFIQRLNQQSAYFFIKSIEQVQGDERDIIIISSGYARNPDGKFYQYFGPLLSYRGENRLNVLMSRAREKIYFISSIKSSDIHTKENSSKGLILFKKLFEFLEFRTVSQLDKQKQFDNYWEYFLNPFRR